MTATAGLLTWLLTTLLSLPLVQDSCDRCMGKGIVSCRPCRGVEKPDCVLFCSESVECKECGGASFVDCKKCRSEFPAELTEQREKGAAWLAEMRKVDDVLGKRLQHIETPHFTLTYDIKRLPYRKKSLKHRDGSYLFGERLEELYEKFTEHLSAEDKDFFNKVHVLIWDKEKNQVLASTRYSGMTSNTASKLMGAAPKFSIYYDKSHLHEEFELHQAVIHHVTHCLLSNVFDGVWPGKNDGGWLDAGLAHYYEIEYYGGVRHYCYREQDTMKRFKFGKWENLVKQLVAKSRGKPIFQTLVKATDQLSPEEHALSWSIVDFLIEKHGDKFGEVAKRVKKREPLNAVYRGALGISVHQAEEEWREYVGRNYGKKKR